MNILIVGRADEVIETIRRTPVSCVLSIEHPGARAGHNTYAPRLSSVPQKILTFWDSEQPIMQAPDRAQVEAGIFFALDHMEDGPVLIHCHAGKARSPGLALGVLAMAYPAMDEKTLIDRLVAIRPIAAPNILVVNHADDIAGRGGRLTQAVLDDPAITLRRADAEQRRQAWAARNPGLIKPSGPSP